MCPLMFTHLHTRDWTDKLSFYIFIIHLNAMPFGDIDMILFCNNSCVWFGNMPLLSVWSM